MASRTEFAEADGRRGPFDARPGDRAGSAARAGAGRQTANIYQAFRCYARLSGHRRPGKRGAS